MSTTSDFETRPESADVQHEPRDSSSLGLIVVWAPGDPACQGAWIPIEAGTSRVLGRGSGRARVGVAGTGPRVVMLRQRPSGTIALPPMGNPAVSRVQLSIEERAGCLHVENQGRLVLRINGAVSARGDLRPGDVVELGGAVVLYCARRPLQLLPAPDDFPVGALDRFGMVGESVAAWELRRDIQRCAEHAGHVLILGETGVGKELVARALHASARPPGAWVARNAATVPASLVDAELFGNARNYPSHGLPERPGLVGAAHEGTLFLDEFADLPEEAQAHLLRVLDSGEYHRLGESRERRSRFRLLAATSRPRATLRRDLAARFDFTLHVPALAERAEDIPWLAAHLLHEMTIEKPVLRARAFEHASIPNLSSAFVAQLLRHGFIGNTRELRQLLWRSLLSCDAGPLRWPDAERVPVSPEPNQARAAPSALPSPPVSPLQATPGVPAPDEIQAALDAHNGSLEATYRALGLSSRHVLARLVKKHRLRVTRKAGSAT